MDYNSKPAAPMRYYELGDKQGINGPEKSFKLENGYHHWEPEVEPLSNIIAGDDSPLRTTGLPVQLVLGITEKEGSSHLLITDAQLSTLISRSKLLKNGHRPSGHNFASLSPISFNSALELKILLKAIIKAKKAGRKYQHDVESARAFENGRLLYYLLNNPHPDPRKFKARDVDPSSLVVYSLHFNTQDPAIDHRSLHERLKNPLMLDLAMTSLSPPSMDPVIRADPKYVILKENKSLGMGGGRQPLFTGNGSEATPERPCPEVLTKREICDRLQFFFDAIKEEYKSAIILVDGEEKVKDALQWFGVKLPPTSRIDELFKQQSGREREDPYGYNPNSRPSVGKREQFYNNYLKHRSRSRSPQRSSSSSGRDHADQLRADKPPPKLYFIDVQKLYMGITRDGSKGKTVFEMAERLGIEKPVDDQARRGWCAAIESRTLGKIWKAMISSLSIMEHEIKLKKTALAENAAQFQSQSPESASAPVQNTAPAPSGEDSEEEENPMAQPAPNVQGVRKTLTTQSYNEAMDQDDFDEAESDEDDDDDD